MKKIGLISSGVVGIIVVLFIVFNLDQKNSVVNEYTDSKMSTRQIVEKLENSFDEDQNLQAAALPEGIVLGDSKKEVLLKDNKDYFYVSIAPYMDQTHECFNHNLITCQGEQVDKMMNISYVDKNNKEIVNINKKTAKNGFVGLWLPRNIEGKLKVNYQGKSATRLFNTTLNSQTCLTDMKLA